MRFPLVESLITVTTSTFAAGLVPYLALTACESDSPKLGPLDLKFGESVCISLPEDLEHWNFYGCENPGEIDGYSNYEGAGERYYHVLFKCGSDRVTQYRTYLVRRSNLTKTENKNCE